MLAIYAPFVKETAVSFEEEPPSPEAFAARVAAVAARHPWLVAAEGDGIAGFACATEFRPRASYRWTCETTVYVAGGRRRRGIGNALYGALLPVLRLQGFRTAVATITLPNPASEALHHRHGFVRTGGLPAAGHKFGRWHEVAWWRNPLLPPDPDPPDPVPFPDLDPGRVAALLAAPGAREGTTASHRGRARSPMARREERSGPVGP